MLVLLPLTFFAGFVDAIAGGGGLISLPAFLAAGLPAHLALGTNKCTAFLGTGLSAGLFIRRGHVRPDVAASAFAGALIGSGAGAEMALRVDGRLIAWLLVAVIPAVAVLVLTQKDLGGRERAVGRGRAIGLGTLTGLVVGWYDGFIGPGTGTFLILAFTLVVGLDLLTACGNAKIVNFASNVAAVAAFVLHGQVDYRLAVPCALCAIAGNAAGARLAMRQGARIVRPMMILVIGLLLGKTGWDLLAGQIQ